MKTKIQDEFIDYGCGFPIILKNVPMIKINRKWIPNIDYNKLERAVALLLCHKQTKLTGSEVRFIRLYLNMNLNVFAKRFGVKHPTVIKWENFKDNHTNMSAGTEKDIRLCLMVSLTGKRQICALYNELISFPLAPTDRNINTELNLDLEKIAI